MASSKIIKIVFVFVVAGLLFSGYLSSVKLFSGVCAFGETCPYFLGYPACWYGFVMYLAMFIVTLLIFLGKVSGRGAIKTDIGISLLGIIFAGNFAIQEVLQSKATGVLGLSTCVYGLIFYILIFVFSFIALKKQNIDHTA